MVLEALSRNGGSRSGFNCRQCGVCCRGRGGIWLDESGRLDVANHLGIEPEKLTPVFLKADRGLWSVETDPLSGCCCFWQAGRCSVHEVKPVMCRQWPFFHLLLTSSSAFSEAKETCCGLTGWDWTRFRTFWEVQKQTLPPQSWFTALKNGIAGREEFPFP